MAIEELGDRNEPLIGGVQIQARKKNGKGIGTMGCVVFDVESGIPLGLSNRHILKKSIGKFVVQPCHKPRTNEFIVGSIFRKGGRGNGQDFAVFKLNIENRNYDTENSIYGLKGLVKEIVEPVTGMKVQKVGQYSGHTFGIVGEFFSDGTFRIDPNPHKPTDEISEGGDSGALWVTDEVEFKAVALHRAGETKGVDRAYAIPIGKVLDSLNVRF